VVHYDVAFLLCGILFSVALGCLGLCLDEFSIFLLAGGLQVMPPFTTLCIFKLRLKCPIFYLALMIFYLVFLVRHFLLYTLSVLRGALRF
jgi:hypothetical protein